MSEFDWQTFDRLCDELSGAYQAWNSWHTSMTNLEYTGFDEHGVEPGEEKIYNWAIAEIREKIKALGVPPGCTECHGIGEIYRVQKGQFGEIIDVDEWPSKCWMCQGSGDYQGGEQ